MEQRKKFIRSFGRRVAKPLSQAKKDTLEKYLPLLGVPAKLPSDLTTLFSADVKRVCLDIGFGGGENLAEKLTLHPDMGFIGSEVFYNGVFSFLTHWEEKGKPENVRLYIEDVRDLVERMPENSLDQIDLFYPDPWHKARHRKRRMIAMETLDLFSKALKTDGLIRVVSDIPDYIDNAVENFTAHKDFKIEYHAGKPFEDWVTTRYEQKAYREGRTPQYMLIKKAS
ncbi:MAG: tRNA (guanosine(46)-N7)-methyltransferase TrmB [Alphaproteobacteria bacterium]|nr:tRNA (guanosine(46)-N7)-methyltransferase TrmB [Alphaproteobacteria bacterium]MBN2780276.1 tRNA (guanosine(46)-N7)-methyltransferase TrmB [Alphaproteobacteria bacterium]